MPPVSPHRKPENPRHGFGNPPWARRLRVVAMIVLGMVAPSIAAAGDATEAVDLRAARIVASGIEARDVHVVARARADGALVVEVRIASAQWPTLDLQAKDAVWRCVAPPSAAPARRQPTSCEGPLSLGGRAAGRLAIDLGDRPVGRWDGRNAGLVLSAGEAGWGVDLARIPLRWLDAFWRRTLGMSPAEGTATGAVHIDPDGATPLSTDLRLSGLAFDSPDGLTAAAGVAGRLRLAMPRTAHGSRFRIEGRWTGGEVLVAPVYLVAPSGGAAFALDLRVANGRVDVDRFDWRDGATLVASGRAGRVADGGWDRLDLDLRSGDLGALASRYLGGVLGPAGVGGLVLAGAATARIAADGRGLDRFAVAFDGASAADPKGRFALAGLDGGLRWSRRGDVESALSWRSAALYGIGLAPSTLPFRGEAGQLRLAAPVAIGVLGGTLDLRHLEWRPPQDDAGVTMRLGFALRDLDLASLSQRLGWPPFEGKVGGELPDARYAGNRVVFDGGLRMDLFGGAIRIDDLALERPFGVAPSLAADVRFDDIDLAPLTRASGFGEITGRLDGRVRDLRLVDWSPVSFDARLLTDRQWPGRRRISQRAVRDISELGGSGLVAGAQARLLRTFDDFGYDRIAVGCVLRGGICRMSGVSRRGEGYVIVQGAGLPRIEVVGFRREVDWSTLVERLVSATSGGPVRVE